MPTSVPTSVHSAGISQHDWEVEGHAAIEDEVATMCKWHKLMSSPAQFKDSVTGELFNTLSQDKCLVNVRSVGPPLILADSVGPPIILADKDEKTKAAAYKKPAR